MKSGLYTYTQNATNISENALNRAKTFSSMTHDAYDKAKESVKREVRQAPGSGLSIAMYADTKKVESTTKQAVMPVATAALGVAWSQVYVAKEYEKTMNSIATQIDQMKKSGDWTKMEIYASEMGISISNMKSTDDAADLGLKNVVQFGTNGANPVKQMNIDGQIINQGTFVDGTKYKNGVAYQSRVVLNDFESTTSGTSIHDSISVVKVERNGNATFDIYKNFVNQETGNISSDLAVTINEKQVEGFIKSGRINTTLEEFRKMNADSNSFTMKWNMRPESQDVKLTNANGRYNTGGIFNRSAFQYSINGNNINFINLGEDAKKHAEMYDIFLRNAKRQLKALDPKDAKFEELLGVSKQVRSLQNKLMRAQALQGQYAKLSNPVKKLTRPFRLLTKPLQEAEAWKGVSMTEQIGRPVMWGAKMASRATFNITYNMALRMKWTGQAIKLARGGKVSLKGAYLGQKAASKFELVPVRKLFKANPIFTALKSRIMTKYYARKIAQMQAFGDRLALKGFEKAGTHFMKKATLANNKLAFRMGKMSKHELKAANKAAKQAFRETTRAGRAINKRLAKKAAKRAARKAVFLNSKIGKPFKLLGELFAKLRAALQQLFAKIAEILSAIAQALLTAFGIFIGVMLILFLLNLAMHAIHDMFTQQSRFASTDAEKWEEYSEKLFTMLEGEHNDFVAKIEGEMQKYPTADVQYPSGAKENYKEIFAAIEVQAQHNPGKELSYEEMKDIAKDMYARTHKIRTYNYSFSDIDGTMHESGTDQAAHIYVNVLRDSAVCYEIYQQEDITTPQGITGEYASAPVECAPEDWMSVVTNVKAAIASTGCEYYDYGANPMITITVNGQTMTIRPDCSGYVTTCLYLYEPSSADVGRPCFATAGELMGKTYTGFQGFRFSGIQNLGVGDILVRIGSEGWNHTEIYAGNGKVYSCGTTDGCRTISYKDYQWVIRPNAAGAGGVSDGQNDSGENSAPVGSIFSSTDSLNLGLSNTTGVEFNEKTGNQDGYEAGILATIEAAKSEPKFGYGYFRTGNKDHTLGDNTTGTTGSDFVRYILSNHGVQLEFEDYDMFFNSKPLPFFVNKESNTLNTSRMKFKTGDILFYCPNTNAINIIKAKQKNNMMSNLDLTSVGSKTVNVDGVDKSYIDVLSENVVPLIYDGSKWVGYCKDITADSNSFAASGGAIRYFATSDFDASRVLNAVRKTGFTIEPVYGATPYFEGWTDYHVAELTEIIHNSCWEEGKIEFYVSSGTVDGEPINATDVVSNNSDTRKDSIDYSWYHEDYFEGGDTWTSNAHDTTFINELMPLFIRHYDKYGVLPSFGSSYVMSITHNRSTEESLKNRNIFELTNSGGVQHTQTEYSYDSDGMVSTTNVSYIICSSYYESFQMWKRRNEDTGLFVPKKYKDEIAAGTAFNNQFSAFQNAGVIKSGGHIDSDGTYADDTKTIYSQNATALIEADKIALERYEKIKAVEDASKKWNDALNASPYKTVGGIGEQADYDSLKEKFQAYENAVKGLQSWEAETHGGYKAYAFITQSEMDTLFKAYNELKNGNENMSKAQVRIIIGYKDMVTTGEKRSGVGHYYPNKTTKPLPQPDRDGNTVMIPPGKVVYIRDSRTKYDHEMPASKTLEPIPDVVPAAGIHTADVNSIYNNYKEAVPHKDDNRIK